MVPGFQMLMRPLLVALSDGDMRSQSELRDLVGIDLGITAEDREQLLPSGRQAIYSNRIGWALTYLVKTGLLTRPRRGYAQITDRGRDVLGQHPSRVDLKVLAQFPEFEDFRTHAGTDLVVRDEPVELLLSPTESISGLVEEANAIVAAEVLARVLAQPPVFLERLVLELLQRMGYGGLESTTQHLGGPGDEGLDGVIRQDALGLDVIYVQAKRYAPEYKIGRPDIQGFVGALVGAQASRGIFITTSDFTADARAYARSSIGSRVVLVDGQTLAKFMVERNVGVRVEQTFELKAIDEDYYED
jgi:restriction system protein